MEPLVTAKAQWVDDLPVATGGGWVHLDNQICHPDVARVVEMTPKVGGESAIVLARLWGLEWAEPGKIVERLGEVVGIQRRGEVEKLLLRRHNQGQLQLQLQK